MLDNYGREISYLRISITERCNLHCTYCRGELPQKPECWSGIKGRELTLEEITEIAEAAAACGIYKIRITGGEPLVRPDVVDICRNIHNLPGIQEVTLTTNGIFLGAYAKELKEAGVGRVNISLDTLNGQKYQQITGRRNLEAVFEGIRAAKKAGLLPIKINVVLMKDFTEEEIRPFVELTRSEAIEIRFIELMPIGPAENSRRFLPGEAVLAEAPELVQDEESGVARLYRLPGAKGRVGLIRPVSRHFCPSCNRVRLTSDGKLKPCLHSAEEVNVRGLHGKELEAAIRQAIQEKPMAHEDFQDGKVSSAGRSMNQIGG